MNIEHIFGLFFIQTAQKVKQFALSGNAPVVWEFRLQKDNQSSSQFQVRFSYMRNIWHEDDAS